MNRNELPKGATIDGYIRFAPDLAADVLELMRAANDPAIAIAKTGVPIMDDDITMGAGTVTVVAARPSHGKSMMLKLLARQSLRQIMANTASAGGADSGDVVVYVTLEEPGEKLFIEIGGHTGYSYRNIQRGQMPDDLPSTIAALQGVKILGGLAVIEHPGLVGGKIAPPITTEIIVSIIERLASEYGKRPRAVFVDYLQLLSATYTTQNERSRTDVVTAAANGVAALARAFHCPVIVAAQAGREVDNRKIKCPLMGDMQHASAIEQFAHTILGLWRPIIDGEREVEIGGGTVSVTNETMLVRVAKSRADGAGGKIYTLNFNPVTLDAFIIDPTLTESIGGARVSERGREWWQ